MKRLLILSALIVASAAVITGCGDGSIYCVTYETRHTGCGGVGWSDWETEHYEFNIDDYREDWTPERVRDKFTGSATECGGGCCIEVQYRNTSLSSGGCS
jgi:hypothetical protein